MLQSKIKLLFCSLNSNFEFIYPYTILSIWNSLSRHNETSLISFAHKEINRTICDCKSEHVMNENCVYSRQWVLYLSVPPMNVTRKKKDVIH